nr:hypothetical protein [uncultured Flavobacterium sp.]
MRWTDERNIHIHTVLHQNKGDTNSRGHIGTELNNKAETILQVAKDITDLNVSIVSAVHIRTREFDKFAFKIDQLGLPILLEEYKFSDNGNKRGVDFNTISDKVHLQTLLNVFTEKSELTYGNLIKSLTTAYETMGYKFGNNKIKELKVFLEKRCFILKLGTHYQLNSKFES